ncbi:MAG TPA: hypothetical protein VL426_02725 [Candidatus Binatia bacterium]|jgi:hypothetical protein|nr:hypothetical protein [Candidatus Binatia bacterium]
MRRTLAVIAIALALGLVQASFVRALPGAASSLDLPLIMVVALVTGFRFGDAFAAAAAAGLATDVLSSMPFGVFTAILLALAFVTMALATRVFTHRSWLGTIGINAAAFALSNVLLLVVRAVRATFAGFPPFSASAPAATLASRAFAALGWQLAAVALAIALAAWARRSFSRFFLLRRDA